MVTYRDAVKDLESRKTVGDPGRVRPLINKEIRVECPHCGLVVLFYFNRDGLLRCSECDGEIIPPEKYYKWLGDEFGLEY
jgi:DNA-directed RNA polymerase subunit RPC12/RpoP